jgi:hypothetical protein
MNKKRRACCNRGRGRGLIERNKKNRLYGRKRKGEGKPLREEETR